VKNMGERVRGAVRDFWRTRKDQSKRQGSRTGQRDQGQRSAATGGAQMDGFVNLVREILVENQVPDDTIFRKRRVELPGYFRPTKKWDLLVVSEGRLVVGVEFKSHIGPSFGNNYNNRTEEALGSAIDLWTAYREGAFAPSTRPWLGYLLLLEEGVRSTSPVKTREPHFSVFDEFRDASYAQRYEQLLTRLLRERLYDGTCFILSDGKRGHYREPSAELSFAQFVEGLVARASAHFKILASR